MSDEIEVKRGPGRPPKVDAAEAAPVSMADMMTFFAQMSAANQASMIEAVKEMKKPTEEEAEKSEAAKARRAAHRKTSIAMAIQEQAARDAKRENCSHLQMNGKHNFRGQINTDGHYRPSCSYCGWQSGAIKANPEQVMGGLGMEKWPNSTANVENFNRMAARSMPAPIPAIPSGMVAEA